MTLPESKELVGFPPALALRPCRATVDILVHRAMPGLRQDRSRFSSAQIARPSSFAGSESDSRRRHPAVPGHPAAKQSYGSSSAHMSGLDGDPSQVKGADLPMQSEIALAQDSCCSIEDLMIAVQCGTLLVV